MNIGLLTVHCSVNPGASLQAYALLKVLTDLEYGVEIIDYRPKYFISEADPRKWNWNRNIKKRIGQLLFGHRQKRDYKNYLGFEDRYLSPKSKTYTQPD